MLLCLGSQETINVSQTCSTRSGLDTPKLLDIQVLMSCEEMRAQSGICGLWTESSPGQGKGNSDLVQWWLWLEAQIGLLWEA